MMHVMFVYSVCDACNICMPCNVCSAGMQRKGTVMQCSAMSCHVTSRPVMSVCMYTVTVCMFACLSVCRYVCMSACM